MRRIVGVLIAIALGIGVFVLWPRSTDDAPPNTEASGTSTTTTTTEATTTSTTDGTTTTTEGSHVVETVEEAEGILRELWFGWFEGIYNQDEERIREVVILEETVETAAQNFGQMEFARAPALDLIDISGAELLMTTDECIAVWAELDVSEFRSSAQGSSGVYVLRWNEDHWELLSVWTSRNDIWEADCESLL
ncbi:MAG TPA: hypothetical protein VF115_15445 [Acidimicrobiia bacterium]